MHYLRACILLLMAVSLTLYAGVPGEIKKDSPIQKELQLSITQKDNPQDNTKVTISISFLGDNETKVNVIVNGKNEELTTTVEDGKVSISFDIEKAHLEKGLIRITGTDPTDANATCVRALLLHLKEYVE